MSDDSDDDFNNDNNYGNPDDFDLSVLPIISKEKPIKLKRPISPFLPDITRGCLYLIIGSVRSGKTNYVNSLLYNPNFYYDLFDNRVWISPSCFNDDSCAYIREDCKCYDTYNDSIIDSLVDYQSSFPTKSKRPTLFVALDDVIGAIPNNSSAYALTTKYRHLSKASMICIMTQKFRKIPNVVRANVNNIAIFWNITNSKEIDAIAEEYNSLTGGYENFIKLYKENIQKVPYSFMYIDVNKNLVWFKHEYILYDGNNNKQSDEI